MISIASIDFSEHKDLYDSISDIDELEQSGDIRIENLIFDDDTNTVWIQWY